MRINSFKTNGAICEKTFAAHLATAMIVRNENLHTFPYSFLPLDS
ncbi:conserved hypothetical protein [Vibrio crassostreae]|nr:conserved hypothetical protein [Vibrio crassostreae]CAK2124517.1 conserved hypothetical protein [Vibrio crassostreae]CAK2337029.1 conserved hypothetical protein [Vibrio crassostreae]CAK2508524.1 conserved hypothetical protein [Vibrio crassostreae]CAK2904136.1 conserved hypothetical protein [Vibrio crassostreae]